MQFIILIGITNVIYYISLIHSHTDIILYRYFRLLFVYTLFVFDTEFLFSKKINCLRTTTITVYIILRNLLVLHYTIIVNLHNTCLYSTGIIKIGL